jgi:hypothetical protein
MVLVRFSILAVDIGGVLEDSFREAVERKMLCRDPLIIRDSPFQNVLIWGSGVLLQPCLPSRANSLGNARRRSSLAQPISDAFVQLIQQVIDGEHNSANYE